MSAEISSTLPGTDADLEKLVVMAKDHPMSKPPESMNNSPANAIAAALDRLIAEMPEELPVAEPVAAPERRSLIAANGWPERLSKSEVELQGGEWKAALAVASPVIEAGGIVVLHGTRGTGKSRMAAEIARAGSFPVDRIHGRPATGPFPPKSALYRTAMRFFTEIRGTYRKDSKQSESELIDALTAPGLLVIDELQERGDTAFEDRLLTHLIDARYGAMVSTILISNLTKDQLFETLSPSIADRIAETGRRIECNWPSFRRK